MFAWIVFNLCLNIKYYFINFIHYSNPNKAAPNPPYKPPMPAVIPENTPGNTCEPNKAPPAAVVNKFGLDCVCPA